MHLTIPPGSIRPLTAEVQEALERLRSEVELTTDPKQKALLLHEVGAIEELSEDDQAAARDLLQAVNADTALREPLEQLAFLLERRGSFKNLPRLLERMVRVASNDEEKARALEALGDFSADFLNDVEGAKKAYEGIAGLTAPGVHLELSWQVVAAELKDPELLVRALGARADRAADPNYRAALRLLLARTELRLGQPAAAQRNLEEAATLETPSRWQALLELERLGRWCGDPKVVRDALLQQAALLDAASRDQTLRRRHSIDAAELTAAKRADAWLRASQAQSMAGERQQAVELARKARELLPSDLCLLHWVLERADALDEAEKEALLREELGGATDPDTIAALALLAAEGATRRGDWAAAQKALARCLEHEPESVVARAAEYALFLGRGEPGIEFARLLESVAESSDDAERKSHYQLLAAVVFASLGSEGQQTARSLLARSAQTGARAELFARVGRMLAASALDLPWFLEATQRLLKNAAETEKPGLLLELVRCSWLAGDETAALFNLEEVSSSEAGAWVSLVLTAYGIHSTSQELTERGERALRALAKLATIEPEPDQKFAERHLVATLRQLGSKKESATQLLQELHQERPQDAVVALQLAGALRADASAASRVLSAAADAAKDPAIASCFYLQAAIASWRAGDRDRAIRDLKKANPLAKESAGLLLSWALRTAHPNDPEERRLMLEATRSGQSDEGVYALERFGLEVGLPARRAEASLALDEALPSASTDLGQALLLARALWPSAKEHSAALSWLQGSGATGNEIALALAFGNERRNEEPSQETLQRLSASWAAAGSLPGLLEWLGASICNGNFSSEIAAKKQIAAQLGGNASAALRASALLVGWAKGEAPQLLASDTPQVQLANLELAPPGCDPRRRTHALQQVESVLSGEAGHVSAVLMGYNQLLAGTPRAALASFHSALSTVAEDLGAWEGVRQAAKQLGNRRLEADALHQLAEYTALPQRAAELLRERAEILFGSADDGAALRALERAVELDIQHFDSFNRLFRHFRAEKNYDKVLELVDRRLEVTNDSKEVLKLCWERARAQRGLGNMEAALADLETVRLLDAEHPGQFALAGEIFVTLGEPQKAAEQLATLAGMNSAPEDQRLMSGLGAADLYENRLDQPQAAIDVLERLMTGGLGTLAVKERLALLLAKTERWDAAVSLLEALMNERQEHVGRVEAARFALVVSRDRLGMPERALRACEKLLANAPADAEAVDFILEADIAGEHAAALLRAGRNALLTAPPLGLDTERLVRLSRIAARLGDADLRQASAGALVCTSFNNRELRDELDSLYARGASWPQLPIDEHGMRELFAGVTDVALGEVARLVAPYVPEALGPNFKTLNLGRRDRLKAPSAPELFQQLEAWLRAVHAPQFEVYVGGEPEAVLLFATPKQPIVVLGPQLKGKLSAEQNAALGRQCLGYLSGTGFVTGRTPHDAAAILLAAGEFTLPGESYPTLPELRRALNKELPGKVKKQVADLVPKVVQAGLSALAWVERADRALDRAALLAVGDVSRVVFSPAQRLQSEPELSAEQACRVADLSVFATSQTFITLRQRLGLGRQ